MAGVSPFPECGLDEAFGFAVGGWPTFAVLAKVGTHAACVGIFIFASPH
jgi:hypothetical protein